MIRAAWGLAGLAAALWGAQWILATFGLFPAAPMVGAVVRDAAMTVAAAVAVLLMGALILNTLLSGALQIKADGLLSAVIYGALAFVAGTLLLTMLGVDVVGILTTSAVLGLGVGLALRSTLGGMVAGLTLSSEPMLKRDGALMLDGECVVIEARRWGHVVVRRPDNLRVIIPNARLAEGALTVFPEDEATRFDVTLHLPPDVPPQRITDLLSEAFDDVEHLDLAHPVQVAPVESCPQYDSIIYRVRLFARSYEQIPMLQGEIMRRAWYALDRAGIHQSRHGEYRSPPWEDEGLEAALDRIGGDLPADLRGAILGAGRRYRFAPSERLWFPADPAHRAVLILAGTARIESEIHLKPLEFGRRAEAYLPALDVQRPSATAEVGRIADRLALDVGPIAEHLVRREIRASPSLGALADALAARIEDPVRREAFRADVAGPGGEAGRRGPGARCAILPDLSGRLTPEPGLRAVTEVTAVTFVV